MSTYLIFSLLSIVFIAGCVQDVIIYPPTNESNESITETTGQQILAGNTTKYVRFTELDYQKALSENKAIYLYFYANWCPICAVERPNIFQAFEEMNYTDVIGFEVHFNDNEVAADDEAISRNFGIAYQHTTIILNKNGEEVFRSLNPISKETIKQEIAEARL